MSDDAQPCHCLVAWSREYASWSTVLKRFLMKTFRQLAVRHYLIRVAAKIYSTCLMHQCKASLSVLFLAT